MTAKLVMTEKGDSHLVMDVSQDLHIRWGMLKADDIANAVPGEPILTNKGIKCFVSDANNRDMFDKLKRSAQIIVAKDAGVILAETLVDKNSTVIDAGTGSGWLTCFLAKYVGHVYSFDVREDHVQIGKKNAEKLGLDNITFAVTDIYESIPEIDMVDLVVLDVPEPHNAFAQVVPVIKSGGFVVCYVPTTNQLHEIVSNKPKELWNYKCIEVDARYWKVSPKSVRPETSPSMHTGFLLFLRRL